MATETQKQQVSLGCGTLILIALIVLFFSDKDPQLKTDLSIIKNQLDQQAQELDRLNGKLDQLLRQPEKRPRE